MSPQRKTLTLDDLLRPGRPGTISVGQTAHVVGTSPDAVYESIAAGTFPFPTLRIGRCIRIPTAPLLAALGYEVAGLDSTGGET